MQWSADEDFLSEAGSVAEVESNPEEVVEVMMSRTPVPRSFGGSRHMVFAGVGQQVMKNIPRFLKRPFRNVLQAALEEVTAAERCRQERGWKLFLLLPRLLLHRFPRGGLISREKLVGRFQLFAQGRWTELMAASAVCDETKETPWRRRFGASCQQG